MYIKRMNTYEDARFSKEVLLQHGGFLVDGVPYEVKILSEREAVICGADSSRFPAIIEEFRFYAPHICKFYDVNRAVVEEFSPEKLLDIPLELIQPSQFYVDEEKLAAVRRFIHRPEDIIIQVMPYGEGYVSLDGHTRLYAAVLNGWSSVRAVAITADDWAVRFAAEAQKRHIFKPKDMTLVSHEEYEEKWNRFCDGLFAEEK